MSEARLTRDETVQELRELIYDYPVHIPSAARRGLKDALAQLEGVPTEIEGDARSTWWYVCGECHGNIDWKDPYCRHCGKKAIWE